MGNKNKVAVIGWDSATFDVLDPLLEAGVLPNLKSLMEQGQAGVLESSIHPLTPTAWSSFMTGVNPGKHGIFDFVRVADGGEFRLNSGANVNSPTIWSYLSQAEKEVLVVNVPMTYPPEKVNGRLLTGLDSPKQTKAYTYPVELASEIMTNYPNYKVGVKAKTYDRSKQDPDVFTSYYVQELIQMTNMRADIVCDLLREKTPDFLMAVFIAPDRVQHALGTVMATGVTPHDGIGQVYQACDKALGKILEHLDDSWTIMLMSDHGACAYNRVFELSTWLAQNNWLKIKDKNFLGDSIEFFRKVQRNLYRVAGRSVTQRSGLKQLHDRIIWPESKAFSVGAFGSIYINKKERFPWGTVSESEVQSVIEQICDQLLSLVDAESNTAVVTKIHLAKDIYSGSDAYLAPDIMLETNENYFIRNNLDHEEGRIFYPAGLYQGRKIAHTGRHTKNGIYVAKGPNIVNKKEKGIANIIDLAPTIIYSYDLPVSAHLDGKVQSHWFNKAFVGQQPVVIAEVDDTFNKDDVAASYSEEDVAKLTEHLKDLGYMD